MSAAKQTKSGICAVCGLKVVDATVSFCDRHLDALRKITTAYEAWKTAYDRISRHDFLERITALRETGNVARDVARLLTEHPDRWN